MYVLYVYVCMHVCIYVCMCVIVPVFDEPVGNLGAVFDPNMNMSAHVSKVIKSANYHLRNIGKIRKFLNTDTTKSAIVSLVTSRLDYCNGLLCGITDELLCRLQKVQNNAGSVALKSMITLHQF